MDVKALIEEATNKITTDKSLGDVFKKNPIEAVEKALGIDLPDDIIEKIVEAVKTKISLDKIGSIAGKLKDLF